MASPTALSTVTSGPPRIGLTSYRSRATFGVWDEPSDLLPSAYSDVITAAGGAPLLLPPTNPGLADVVLDGLHGLVLSGGPDVDPARYGAAPDPHTGEPQVARDSWELALAEAALRRGLPLLAVCRGMQVLAVALGGSLLQHLPDAVGNDSHCPTLGAYGRHAVRLAAGSRLGSLLGLRIDVATHHHQAVDVLPAGAVATGWADDGTIEAFEVVDAPWAMAVQWHPEVDGGDLLFREFVSVLR
jgi:gamma-glutamyl-gamma-aminobutyrate hydrolase PuuD